MAKSEYVADEARPTAPTVGPCSSAEAPPRGDLEREQQLVQTVEGSCDVNFKTEGMETVWVETMDGELEEVEKEVAVLSPVIYREVVGFGNGKTKDNPVVLPKQVAHEVLQLMLEYCRFHRATGRSDKERKLFDEKFIRMDTRRLCELTSAADSLSMKPLVDLTSRALARMIEGKTPEEIRETFHLPDDLTEEEKLEPVRNVTDDPRIRLLNRLYAKKRKALLDHKALGSEAASALAAPPLAPGPAAIAPVERPAAGPRGAKATGAGRGAGAKSAQQDDRSLDDLLSFITGGEEGAKPSKAKKKKAAKEKRKKGKGERRSEEDEARAPPAPAPAAEGVRGARAAAAAAAELVRAGSLHAEDLFPEDGFDDDDGPASEADGLDPAQRLRLDQEVADFARRLNASMQDRLQDFDAQMAPGEHAHPPEEGPREAPPPQLPAGGPPALLPVPPLPSASSAPTAAPGAAPSLQELCSAMLPSSYRSEPPSGSSSAPAEEGLPPLPPQGVAGGAVQASAVSDIHSLLISIAGAVGASLGGGGAAPPGPAASPEWHPTADACLPAVAVPLDGALNGYAGMDRHGLWGDVRVPPAGVGPPFVEDTAAGTSGGGGEGAEGGSAQQHVEQWPVDSLAGGLPGAAAAALPGLAGNGIAGAEIGRAGLTQASAASMARLLSQFVEHCGLSDHLQIVETPPPPLHASEAGSATAVWSSGSVVKGEAGTDLGSNGCPGGSRVGVSETVPGLGRVELVLLPDGGA